MKRKSKISFSIIIPSYNSKQTIRKTLESIIQSDYDKNLLEVIVIDDGSSDDTYNYVNDFIKEYDFIHQFHKENGNWGSVINYVKNNKLAHNDVISILDADDIYLKQTFKLVNKKIKNADIFSGAMYRNWGGGYI